MTLLGSKLEALCKTGRQEIMLVAPFIKATTLSHLLNFIDSDVSLYCITRWRSDEIVAGVSDIEIWPLLRMRASTSLFLRPDLHAKYYRSDSQCLVGSANLTATALGWSHQPNLEILVPLPEPLHEFETKLMDGCVPVDEDLYNQTLFAVELLRKELPQPPLLEITPLANIQEAIRSVPQQLWLPTLRYPADLYIAYIGRADELASATRSASISDLNMLNVPPGLSRSAFDIYIGSLLLHQALIHKIDNFLLIPQRFGAVRDLIHNTYISYGISINAGHAWQTLMRWLFYFLPMRYKMIPSRHSEVVQRILK